MRIDPQANSSDIVTGDSLSESSRKSHSSTITNTAYSNEDTVSPLSSTTLESVSIREDKVSTLRQQIQSGEYQIDHASLADAMISAFSGQVAS